jgi:hypothetical protein
LVAATPRSDGVSTLSTTPIVFWGHRGPAGTGPNAGPYTSTSTFALWWPASR